MNGSMLKSGLLFQKKKTYSCVGLLIIRTIGYIISGVECCFARSKYVRLMLKAERMQYNHKRLQTLYALLQN